jgi:hypothetical protein
MIELKKSYHKHGANKYGTNIIPRLNDRYEVVDFA